MKIKKLKKRWYILFISIFLMIAGIITYATQVTWNESVNDGYTLLYNGNTYATGIKYIRNTQYAFARDIDTPEGQIAYNIGGTFVNNDSAVYCLEHEKRSPDANYTSGSRPEINLGVYYAIYARQQDLDMGMNNFDAEYYVRQLLVWYFVSGDTESGLKPCTVNGSVIRLDHNGLPGNVDENTMAPFVVKTGTKEPIVKAYARGLKRIRELVAQNKDKDTIYWDENNGKYDVTSYNNKQYIVKNLVVRTADNIKSTKINLEGWKNGAGSADPNIKFKLNANDPGYITSVEPGQHFVAIIPNSYNVDDYYLKCYTTDTQVATGEIWVTDSGLLMQKIVRPTTINAGVKEKTIGLRLSTGVTTVKKVDVDSDLALAGATFQVYRMYTLDDKPNDPKVKEYVSPHTQDKNGNNKFWVVPVARATTDGNGISQFRLEAGVRYRILEVEPPEGYTLPETEGELNQEVYVGSNGQSDTIVFKDKMIKDTNVYIRKVSAEVNEDGEQDRLAGAVFTVEDITADGTKTNANLTKDGSEDTKNGSNLKEWKTDSRGVISAPALGNHTYRITEVKPPSGYTLPTNESDRVKEKTIDPNNKWNVVEFQDPKVKGTLAVHKTNRDKTINLEGIEFSLYTKTGGFVAKRITNAAGKIQFENLDLGTYILKETKGLKDYIISDELSKGVTVEVTQGNNEVEYSAINEKVTGKIKIKKIDAENGKVIGKATYGIYNNSDCSGKPLDTLTTDDTGMSKESKLLEYGTYYLKELVAPDGYELSSKVTPITINQKVSEKTYTVTVSDEPKRLLLRLFKKDSAEERYLSGAVFQLYKVEDDGTEKQISYTDGDWVLQDKFITNSDGYLEIPCWLGYGKYKLVEVEAPEGYNKISDIEIDLDGNSKVNSVGVVSVAVNNDKILGNIKLTKVRGLQNITVPNTTFSLYRITDNNIMYGYKGNDSDTDKKIQQSLESLVTEGKQITIKGNTTNNNLDQHPAVPVIDSITVDKDFPQQAGTELNVKANVRGPEGMQIKFVAGDLNGNEYVKQDFSNKTEAKVSFNNAGSKRIIVVVKYNDNGVNKFIRGSIFFQIVAKSDKIDAKDLEKPLQVVQNTPTIYDDQPSPNTEEKNVYNQTNLVKENLNGVEYVNSYTTGEDGSLSVNDLPYGYYFFVEEKVDAPCVQDTTPIIFKINEQGKTLEYTMHNDTVTEFEITKTDVSDGKLLPNTEFAIYADDKTTVVDSDVTDENGVAKFWLTPGTYYYQEIKAPEGYQIDTGLYEFTINDDDTIVRAHMTNSKQGFIITKTDVSDGTLLPNTEFAIYKEDKTTIIETGITDEKGEAKFSLGTGTYYYQEIKAPEGYQIDNELYQFVIKENDEIVRAHMTDSKLPKTGTVFTKDNLPLEITLVVIGVSGLALFLARRKARK